MQATRDHMQVVLLNLERVLGRLPVNGIVKVHRRQVTLLAAPVTNVADLAGEAKRVMGSELHCQLVSQSHFVPFHFVFVAFVGFFALLLSERVLDGLTSTYRCNNQGDDNQRHDHN